MISGETLINIRNIQNETWPRFFRIVHISIVHLGSLNCYPKLLLTAFNCFDAKRFNNCTPKNMKTVR